jgi:hypothetical protein
MHRREALKSLAALALAPLAALVVCPAPSAVSRGAIVIVSDDLLCDCAVDVEAHLWQRANPNFHVHTDRALFDALTHAPGGRRSTLEIDFSRGRS